ncbi:MAG: hypothetical protein HYX68_04225 [Planctomycetes bacterium]|nr:hypothetical protein [Planctomycetota bacterium]
MSRFWVIAPFEFDAANPDEFEKAWQYDLDSGIISIGWGDLGDISTLSKEQLLEHICDTYKDEPLNAARNFRVSLHYFWHSIKPGHTVIARRGRKQLAAIGTVKRAVYYDPKKNPVARNSLGTPYSSHLDIQWAKSPRNRSFSKEVFGMHTVHKITENKYLALLQLDK